MATGDDRVFTNCGHHISYTECMLLNRLNAELKLICHLLALLGAHPILHLSRIRVNDGVRARQWVIVM